MPQKMDDHGQPQKTTSPAVFFGIHAAALALSWGLWNTGLSEREAVWDLAEDGGEVVSGLGQTRLRRGSSWQWLGEKEAGVHAELKDLSLTAYVFTRSLFIYLSICLSVIY